MKLTLPEPVAFALERLEESGYEAYVVGGCLRDSLLGRTPHDWDVATSALPHQTKQVLAGQRLFDTGVRHGTLTLLREGMPVEITTYRVDGRYTDGRRPDDVRFTSSLAEDLSRRDFTINALAYHPQRGLVDLVGGRDDLKRGIIRCVGDPPRRFEEDALRILRGLRFAATLGFTLEAFTAAALYDGREGLRRIAAERIFAELCALLCAEHAAPVLRDYAGVLEVFLPELAPMVGFEQHSPYHCYDVWEHTLRAVAAIPPDPALRLTMLFHDIGKPDTFTLEGKTGHFYGHAAHSRELAGRCLGRLRCDRRTRARVDTLIRYHDAPLKPQRDAVRRWLGRLGEETFRELLRVHRADNAAQAPCCDRRALWDAVEETLNRVLAEGECFSLSQLAVSGRDLLALGLAGKEIGQALQGLLEAVLDGRLPNDRAALLKAIHRR